MIGTSRTHHPVSFVVRPSRERTGFWPVFWPSRRFFFCWASTGRTSSVCSPGSFSRALSFRWPAPAAHRLERRRILKLNIKALSFASGIVAAASFIVCALAVAASPGLTSRFFSFVFHIDLTSLSRTITWASFFGGMLLFSVGVAIHVGLTAWCYNRLAAK